MKYAHSSQIPQKCYYSNCPSHTPLQPHGGTSGPGISHIIRKGSYLRASDSKRIGRFYCHACKRLFSRGSYSSCFGQKKRRINSTVFTLLNSCVSQRRIALILKINRKTVVRKLLFLAKEADRKHKRFLQTFESEQTRITEMQFDEMESFERSKCLPLSIPLVVHPKATVTTDQNPKYPSWLKPHFKDATHVAVKGRRGCVVGQGELKKIGFDPLFDLNHTCAMIRANINRLVRRISGALEGAWGIS